MSKPNEPPKGFTPEQWATIEQFASTVGGSELPDNLKARVYLSEVSRVRKQALGNFQHWSQQLEQAESHASTLAFQIQGLEQAEKQA